MTTTTEAPTSEDRPLPVDPGHVRARAHYEAMLAELLQESEE